MSCNWCTNLWTFVESGYMHWQQDTLNLSVLTLMSHAPKSSVLEASWECHPKTHQPSAFDAISVGFEVPSGNLT
jgi:hypothetical protein